MSSTTSSLTKTRKLIDVLRKCNGKSVVSEDALISPKAARILIYCGLLLLTGGLLAGTYYLQPRMAPFISAESLARILMVGLLIMSFVLAIKDIVTVLYTADDLETLLPMPLSATQIVMAKLATASILPVTISFVIMNSICLGFGIREGAGVTFIIGTVLSSILIPVTGISVALLLIVIFFRVFGFIRNRDITVAIGGIFTLGLTVAYIVITNTLDTEDAGKTSAALNSVASVSSVFPNISFMSKFMSGGSIIGIIVSILITACAVGLSLLAVKSFYLSTALAMQNTATGSGKVSREELSQISMNSTLKALTLYEGKSARRNPAYLIYGFVMSFVWPLLFALPLVLSKDSMLKGVTAPFGTTQALIASMAFALTASGFACGFNILPGSAFTREGDTFTAIRALPVGFEDYYRSKRNFSLFLVSLGSVLYVILGGIACLVTGFIPVEKIWVVIPGACSSFLLNIFFVNWMLLVHSRKPRFTWDSEAEFSRKLGGVNLVIIFFGMVAVVVFLIVISQLKNLDDAKYLGTFIKVSGVWLVINLISAFLMNKHAVKKAAQNLSSIE